MSPTGLARPRHAAEVGRTQATADPAPALTWRRTYERASVERFLAYADGERARRLTAIEEARARAAAAEAAAVQPSGDAPARLAALVVAATSELRAARSDTEAAIARILQDAELEVARIRAAALDEAASIRSWSSRQGSLGGPV